MCDNISVTWDIRNWPLIKSSIKLLEHLTHPIITILYRTHELHKHTYHNFAHLHFNY